MKQYHDILRSILQHGAEHQDRTGVGTISHFGYQTRFDLREGFPIVTTKRVPFRWIAEELFWFLSGDTNEPNLRAKGVDIWKEWRMKNTHGALVASRATSVPFTVICGAHSAGIIRSETVSIRSRA